jgi:hypothetical protein
MRYLHYLPPSLPSVMILPEGIKSSPPLSNGMLESPENAYLKSQYERIPSTRKGLVVSNETELLIGV